MHAALDNHIGLHLPRFDRQLQTVADHVGHTVKNVGGHVIVGKDHRIAVAFQPVDRQHVGRMARPVGERHDPVHPGMNLGCCPCRLQ